MKIFFQRDYYNIT